MLAVVFRYLSASPFASPRGLEDLCEVVFGIPVSQSSVTALQQQMNVALEPAYQEIAAAVRPVAAKNVDETGWKQAGKKRWLWTATAALFVIHLRRRGEPLEGLVSSDRWSAYLVLPLQRRQLCWAHLRWDFQAETPLGRPWVKNTCF